MAWEFAAMWADDDDHGWYWTWRRVADDSGERLEQSARFVALEDCIEDAKKHGFDDDYCPTG